MRTRLFNDPVGYIAQSRQQEVNKRLVLSVCGELVCSMVQASHATVGHGRQAIPGTALDCQALKAVSLATVREVGTFALTVVPVARPPGVLVYQCCFKMVQDFFGGPPPSDCLLSEQPGQTVVYWLNYCITITTAGN